MGDTYSYGAGAVQGLESVLAAMFKEQQEKQRAKEQETEFEIRRQAAAREQRRIEQEDKRLEQQFNSDSATVALRGLEAANRNNEQYLPYSLNGQRLRDNPDSSVTVLHTTPGEPRAQPVGSDYQQALGRYAQSLGKPVGNLTPTDEAAFRKLWGQADDVAPRPPATQLTPNQELLAINRLTNDWKSANTTANELKRQASMMDTGLQAARAGNLAAGSQAVLVTFQKILDPTSVVRESEYARSAAGQSLLNQAQGYMERLAQGGAGVPLSELEKFAQVAKTFAQNADSGLAGRRSRLERTAKAYGLDPTLLFDDVPTAPTTGQPSSAGGATPSGMVNMKAPNGQVKAVPVADVNRYKAAGAVVVP